MRVKDKVAVITGAASGIGLAMARLFVEEGAKVVAADWNASSLETAAWDIGGGLVTVKTNVADEAECAVRSGNDSGRVRCACVAAG